MNGNLKLKEFIEVNCKLPEITKANIKDVVETIKTFKIDSLPAKVYVLLKYYNSSWDLSYSIILSAFTFGYGLEQFFAFISWADPKENEVIDTSKFIKYIKENKKHLSQTKTTNEVVEIFKR